MTICVDFSGIGLCYISLAFVQLDINEFIHTLWMLNNFNITDECMEWPWTAAANESHTFDLLQFIVNAKLKALINH